MCADALVLKQTVLAGPLIVGDGAVPGRPLGAKPEFTVGERAAAGSHNHSTSF